MNYRNAALFVLVTAAVAMGVVCLANRHRRTARQMPRKPEDLSRWENEGGAPRPHHMEPPVETVATA